MFDVNVTYFSQTHAAPSKKEVLDARYHSSLQSLLAESDIISLHYPNNATTHHLIDAETLTQMKPTTILINTAQNSVMDTQALNNALKTKHIAATRLDVYEGEPKILPTLIHLENTVLLPHLKNATLQARTTINMQITDNLDTFFTKHPPPNRVA